MTDSPRLEEVFAAVLREHPVRNDSHNMQSYCLGADCPESRSTKPWGWAHRHQAERLAARFEELGIVADAGGGEIRVLVDRDLKNYPAQRVPVFRLVGGDQEDGPCRHPWHTARTDEAGLFCPACDARSLVGGDQ